MTPRSVLCIALVAGTVVAQQQPRPTFRVGTVGIAVDVTVTDGLKTVVGLQAADFELLDNGVRQQISAATLEAIPFDLTLVVDTSASLTAPMMEQFKKDMAAISAMLRGEDRIRLVTFATRGNDVFGWRDGRTDLPLTRIAAGGATAFYQTLSAVLLRQTDPGRRQLIVAMTDAFDNVSFLDAPDIRDLARLANAVLHIVIRRPNKASSRSWGWVPYTGPGFNDALREAAESTGGRLRATDTDTSLIDAFKTALDEFRTGYVLWYTPAGVDQPGWHTIQVRVKQPKFVVRARNGYDAGGGRP